MVGYTTSNMDAAPKAWKQILKAGKEDTKRHFLFLNGKKSVCAEKYGVILKLTSEHLEVKTS